MKIKNLILKIFINLLIFLAISINLHGQSFKGNWYGKLGEPYRFRIILRIDSSQNGYRMKIDFPDEFKSTGIPAKKLLFDFPSLSFGISEYINFEGYINSGYNKITGILKFPNSFQQSIFFTHDSIPP